MNWQQILIAVPVLLFSLTFHEASHAWMAHRRGDDTAKLAGRLTLNPLPHISLVGTILLPAILIISGAGFIIGAAKPVPVDVRNLRNPKRDHLAVSLAGPGSNILLALGFTIILQVAYLFGVHEHALGGLTSPAAILMGLLQYGVLINLILAGFNILPIPPLDGSSLLISVLPPKAGRYISQIAPYGFIIVILLVATGLLTPYFRLFYGLTMWLTTPLG
jgi:Zn-dependent protease